MNWNVFRRKQKPEPVAQPSTGLGWTEEEMDRIHNGGIIRHPDYGDGVLHRGWVMTRDMDVYGCALGLAEDDSVDDLGYVRDANGVVVGVFLQP